MGIEMGNGYFEYFELGDCNWQWGAWEFRLKSNYSKKNYCNKPFLMIDSFEYTVMFNTITINILLCSSNHFIRSYSFILPKMYMLYVLKYV